MSVMLIKPKDQEVYNKSDSASNLVKKVKKHVLINEADAGRVKETKERLQELKRLYSDEQICAPKKKAKEPPYVVAEIPPPKRNTKKSGGFNYFVKYNHNLDGLYSTNKTLLNGLEYNLKSHRLLSVSMMDGDSIVPWLVVPQNNSYDQIVDQLFLWIDKEESHISGGR